MKRLLLILLFCSPVFAGDIQVCSHEGSATDFQNCIQAQTRLMHAQADSLSLPPLPEGMVLIQQSPVDPVVISCLNIHVRNIAALEARVKELELAVNALMEYEADRIIAKHSKKPFLTFDPKDEVKKPFFDPKDAVKK